MKWQTGIPAHTLYVALVVGHSKHLCACRLQTSPPKKNHITNIRVALSNNARLVRYGITHPMSLAVGVLALSHNDDLRNYSHFFKTTGRSLTRLSFLLNSHFVQLN